MSLWICYAKNCYKKFIIGGIFKLFGDLCGLIGPLSISYIVDFIHLKVHDASGAVIVNEITIGNFHNESTNNVNVINNRRGDSIGWPEFVANGWIVSCIVLTSFLMQGTLSQASTHFVNMEGIKIKNALQGLIYRKTLLLNVSAASVRSNDDKKMENEKEKEEEMYDVSPGTITNLMSEDSLNVMSFFWIAHYVWSIPLKVCNFNCVTEFNGTFLFPHDPLLLQIALVVYCLYLKLGVSSLIGSAVTIIVMLPLQFLVGREMSKNSEYVAVRQKKRVFIFMFD
jgi:ABC-type multidrug transport system fused ATPase/permease subunit